MMRIAMPVGSNVRCDSAPNVAHACQVCVADAQAACSAERLAKPLTVQYVSGASIYRLTGCTLAELHQWVRERHWKGPPRASEEIQF
jgi:hypothetical protein